MLADTGTEEDTRAQPGVSQSAEPRRGTKHKQRAGGSSFLKLEQRDIEKLDFIELSLFLFSEVSTSQHQLNCFGLQSVLCFALED